MVCGYGMSLIKDAVTYRDRNLDKYVVSRLDEYVCQTAWAFSAKNEA